MGPGFRERCQAAAEGLGRTSLVARLSETSGTKVILEALESGRPRLGAWAARELSILPHDERDSVVALAFNGSPSLRLGMLRVIVGSRGNGDGWPASTGGRVEAELENPDLSIRVAAARCLARHAPERLDELRHVVEPDGGSEVARMFCLSGREELIRPLVEYSDRRLKSLLPAIGWLVTPSWLARTHEVEPALAIRLAHAFGYLEGEPTGAVWELLAEGWSFAPTELAEQLADWTETRRRLARALVPTGLATSELTLEGDAHNPLWRATLIAAVRDADRSNLQEFLERSPFDPQVLTSPQIAAAMHAPLGYLRRTFVEDPLKEAERLQVCPGRLAAFLVDSARVALETLEEPRAELQIATLAKWRALCRLGPRAQHLRIERFPILTDDDAPDLKSVVLGKRLPTRLSRKGTSGMEAISRMAVQAGLADPSPVLGEIEECWGQARPTMGMELQVPLVDRDVSLCWKQALRSLGTPSPRRPEYFQMVEASFRPAAGIASLILGPLLLLKLGLISRPQDMALHVSVSGDLGEKANDLAFLLYFIAMGRQQRAWPTGMKWVLSKGLVHFHPDAEPLGQATSGRTEIRVLRCFAVESEGRLKLDAQYIDQAVAAALLATAMRESGDEITAIREQFHLGLTQLVETLPEAFCELRQSSFYDSTGDGNDPEWLESLPILRTLSRVRESMQVPGVRDRVADGCRQLRDKTSASIIQALGLSSPLESIPQRDIYWTKSGWPLFIPAELQELLTATSC